MMICKCCSRSKKNKEFCPIIFRVCPAGYTGCVVNDTVEQFLNDLSDKAVKVLEEARNKRVRRIVF